MHTVNLTCPTSWRELSQQQLRYVFYLLATFADLTVVKTYMFVRFTGIRVIRRNRFGWQCAKGGQVFYIQLWQIHSFIQQLDWVGSYETMDNRLDVVQGLHAVDPLLQFDAESGRIVPFEDYLNMETQYQHFHNTRGEAHIDRLASFLYRRPDYSRVSELSLTPAERLATIAWYAHIKLVMAAAFPHFFRKAKSDSDSSDLSILESYNVQLRALTDGDVTKEHAVKQLDCWRALTELDAKAREAEEFRRKFPKAAQ